MMQIANKKYLVRILKNPLEKGIGLMWKRKFPEELYLFTFDTEQRVPITMLFVFFPINIYWLDKNKKVIARELNAKPFTLNINPNVKARFVLETPTALVLKVGNLFEF